MANRSNPIRFFRSIHRWWGLPVLGLLAACGGGAGDVSEERKPAPVEVAPIETGRIELRRTLSGTLRSSAEFTAAAKITGQVRELRVDVSDPVERDGVVALLDDEEFVQRVKQVEAELQVAEANLKEAEAQKENAQKELERMTQLRERGIASDSQFDAARAAMLSGEAGVAVARANVARGESALEGARIQLGYTRVRASWSEGDERRVVAERLVDEGDTVAANEGLFRIVDLNPLHGVIYVSERDYGQVQPGDLVRVFTDAYAGESFEGKVLRVAPVFSETSRQALVEFQVANPEHRLKPGMFARVNLVLDVREEATIVPDEAIVRRNDADGFFLLGPDRKTVSWRPVTVGIREEDRVQVLGEGITGEVVVLGQQLLEDGSAVRVETGDDAVAENGNASGS